MSRLIILLTILGFILTRSMKIVVVGFITLIVIYLFYYQNWYKYNRNNKEGFNSGDESSSGYTPIVNVNNSDAESVNQSSNTNTNQDGTPLKEFVKDNYQRSTKTNPFGNVLLTDIMDNPDRPSAPPNFNPSVSSDVRKNVKGMVQMLNPGIKCSDKQLFNNLYDNFDLDQSNRVFNATANTRMRNVVELNARLNSLLEIMNALSQERADNVQQNKQSVNQLNATISQKLSDLQAQYNRIKKNDNTILRQTRMVEYTKEKNEAVSNQIGLYIALNVAAIGMIFFVSRSL